ncbi:DUF1015 family protein [Nonomuraea sp. NPDC000554]|uniref:DUF1015 family protein n=1 Tax=Nonomuraea sp. NPDC000554 TaxID=3154259 RepID=UPI00332E125F
MGTPELPVPEGLVLRPFRGVRFAVDDPAKVTSPPYDLISNSDIRDLLDTHPNNVVRLILPCAPSPSPSIEPTEPDASTEPTEPAGLTTPAELTKPAAPTEPPAPSDSPGEVHIASPVAQGRPDTNADEPYGNAHETPETADIHGTSAERANDLLESPEAPGVDGPAATPAQGGEPPQASSEHVAEPSKQPKATIGHLPAAPGKPIGDTPWTFEIQADERYADARETLRSWLETGVLVPDDLPALYVYEQSGPNVLQRGLIGDIGLADPAQRIILPHEDVLPGPIADRLALMSTTQANLEPIFLLYDGGNGSTSRLVDDVASTWPPLVNARTADGITHRLWAVTEQAAIEAVNADLHDRQALIADGHHRYATYRVLQRLEHAARDASTPQQTPGQPPTPVTPPRPTPSDATAFEPGAPRPTSPAATFSPTSPETATEPTAGAQQPTPPREVAEPTGPKIVEGSSTPGTPQEPAAPSISSRLTEPTAPPVGPWDFGLALLVDSTAYPPDLKAIHRVIPGLPLTEATARAKGSWRVHDYANLAEGLAALHDAAEPAFLLAGESSSHLLTDPDPVQLAHAMPADHSDQWNSLNTSILSEFVLPKVWGMHDDEQTVRIVHHDPEAAVQLAVRTGGTAVILKPLAIDDVLAVAAGGERVPRKSTSFGPKPRTGLVLRTFAID